MFGWWKRRQQRRGAENAKAFLATNPAKKAVQERWGCASVLNDDYDTAWKKVIREAGVL